MFVLTCVMGALAQDSGMIQLADELDEAADGQYYCFDAFGDWLDEDDGIQTHTCKDRPHGLSEDQDWTVHYPLLGQVSPTQWDGSDYPLCVTADRLVAGGWLHIEQCSARYDRHQQWYADTDGIVHSDYDSTLCWTIDRGVHGRCGDELCDNYKRNVTLQDCASFDPKWETWIIPGGTIGIP